MLVQDVVEGGPAAQAGILPTRRAEDHYIPGDLIVAINAKPVRNYLDLYRILDRFKAGDTVTLTIQREEGEKQIPVTLRVLP